MTVTYTGSVPRPRGGDLGPHFLTPPPICMLITLLTCDLFAVNIILLTYGVVYHPCYFDDFDVSLCGVVPRYASAVAWAQHICGDTLTKCFFFASNFKSVLAPMEHHSPLAGDNRLHCLVTEAHVHESLAQGIIHSHVQTGSRTRDH